METLSACKRDAKQIVSDVALSPEERAHWHKRITNAKSHIQVDNLLKSFWEYILGGRL